MLAVSAAVQYRQAHLLAQKASSPVLHTAHRPPEERGTLVSGQAAIVPLNRLQ